MTQQPKPGAAELVAAATAAGVTLSTAESCTGGLIAKRITDVAGSSSCFEQGFVTYSNAAKTRALGVSSTVLAAHGAVSREVVEQMAMGACREARADFAVAVSGVAGPGGGSPEKPVGTVWIAWASADYVAAICQLFDGDRAAVREATAAVALAGLLERVMQKS